MEERVSQLRHVIVSTIKGPLVLECMMMTPAVISQRDGVTLKRLYSLSIERANHRLLDLLYISTAPEKWRVFLDALQKTEYSCLLRLLRSTDQVTLNTCCVLIDLFAEKLKYINLHKLLAALKSRDVITEYDREEIVAKQTSQGSVAGTMVLLDHIQAHLGPQEWYSRFLQALHDSKQRELVKLIDPTFYDEPAQTIVDKEAMSNCTLFDESSASPSIVRHEGNLTRKHEMEEAMMKAVNRSWEKVYVVVHGPSLSCYKDQIYAKQGPSSLIHHEKPIDLKGSNCEYARDYSKRPNVFRLRLANGAEYLFMAKDQAEMDNWIGVISSMSQRGGAAPAVPDYASTHK